MHRALVLSVFSSTFLVLTTLSGTTGDPGIQPLGTLHDDILKTPAQVNKWLSRNPKRDWDQFNGGWGKSSAFSNDDLAELLYDLSKYYENEKDSSDEVEKRDWNNFQESWGKRIPLFRSSNKGSGKTPPTGDKWGRLNGGWG